MKVYVILAGDWLDFALSVYQLLIVSKNTGIGGESGSVHTQNSELADMQFYKYIFTEDIRKQPKHTSESLAQYICDFHSIC